jgi:hypothetical protein
LQRSDATTALWDNTRASHLRSETSSHAPLGGAAPLFAALASAVGAVRRTSSPQTTAPENSDGANYSRGLLLAARCSAQAADTTGATTSALPPTPNSTDYCASRQAADAAGDAPRNGLDRLSQNAVRTNAACADETTHHRGTPAAAILTQAEPTCPAAPPTLGGSQGALPLLVARGT